MIIKNKIVFSIEVLTFVVESKIKLTTIKTNPKQFTRFAFILLAICVPKGIEIITVSETTTVINEAFNADRA